jgi:hypothetical protein
MSAAKLVSADEASAIRLVLASRGIDYPNFEYDDIAPY